MDLNHCKCRCEAPPILSATGTLFCAAGWIRTNKQEYCTPILAYDTSLMEADIAILYNCIRAHGQIRTDDSAFAKEVLQTSGLDHSRHMCIYKNKKPIFRMGFSF